MDVKFVTTKVMKYTFAETMFRLLKRGVNYGRRHIEDFCLLRRAIDKKYQSRLAVHAEFLSSLDSKALDLVSTLHREGVIITSLDDFNASLKSSFWTHAMALKHFLASKRDVEPGKKPFILAPQNKLLNTQKLFSGAWMIVCSELPKII